MTTEQTNGHAIRRIVGKGIARVVRRQSKNGASPRCQIILFFDDDTACEIYGTDVEIARNLDTAARWRERVTIRRDYELLTDTADPSS
jgi:hypothetical protein